MDTIYIEVGNIVSMVADLNEPQIGHIVHISDDDGHIVKRSLQNRK